jgi:hypothetical protein
MKIYSKIEPKKVLHVIKNVFDINTAREDLTPSNEFLQASIIKVSSEFKSAGHIHKEKISSSSNIITQEAWIVMSGSIQVKLFDLDKKFLGLMKLEAGNIMITFYGGHSIQGDGKEAIILEVKNGPYTGRDYELINE